MTDTIGPSPRFELRPLSRQQMADLALGQRPAGLPVHIEPDALPPPFVLARGLRLLAAGHAAVWGHTLLMVHAVDGAIVGSCGFKTAPTQGRVEIGYGVAAAWRRQGAASAAVRQLLQIAFAAGATEVLAEVVPDNAASAAVVRGQGFVRQGSRIDEGGERVILWLRQPQRCGMSFTP